ncbi:putative 4-hydroxybenzoyl-CoA thioesterase [Sulfurovum sp. enrichment culture clone C5]|uniref:Putative 4-hydroxybenzoyl-CoA thioesterase n=1 Tax=Sulfurovum sp. enrichment culture clone C5 TaxID=497650 RepID=A0A0S4XLZ0_9BACT|nr:putative 4-hydroxybenzoyl-CoA thioesterase [Sulfurovum sp. enrichment culture clone C5]
MKIRVYYEDTDAGGIVYHANYIKYCERARSEVFFENDLSPEMNGCHFVAGSMTCKFIKSAKLGDILEVKTELLENKNVSLLLKQTIFLKDEKIFEMEIKVGFVDKSGKITKIPQELKTIFE